MKRKYSTPTAFRTALEDLLNKIAKKEGIEIIRLRRSVAFDRLLARIFSNKSSPFVLKGGYAMELRTDNARGTKDIDLAIKNIKLNSTNRAERSDVILDLLVEQSHFNLEDFFEFNISGPTQDIAGAPYGGARFRVDAKVDDRIFSKFQLDVGSGDYWMEPHEYLKTRAWMPEAGLQSLTIPVIPKEQQFAEKLHSYTLPRNETPNSRVKDLIDILLLIESDELNNKEVIKAIENTFERRSTHEVPTALSTPPPSWGASFASMTKDSKLNSNMAEGFKKLTEYFSYINQKRTKQRD